MPIQLGCNCGKQLKVGDEHAGKRVKCPGCGAILTVPLPGEGEVSTRPGNPPAQPYPAETQPRPASTRAGKPPVPPRSYPEEKELEEIKTPRRPPRRKAVLWPWITAAGVILLIGGGLLVWFLFRGGSTVTEDLALIPGDAQGFYTLRVAEVWNLPDIKKLRQQLPPEASKPIAELEAKVGLSLDDLDRASLAVTDFKAQEIWSIFSLKKPYDRKKIMDLFPPGVRETKQKNYSYHVFPGPKPGLAVLFVNDKIIVAGTEGGVVRCLKQMEEKKRSGPLADAIQTAAGKHHLVAAFVPPASELQKLKALLPPQAAAFGSLLEVQSGIVTMNQEGTASILDLRLVFPNDAKAKDAKTSIDGLLAMGKMFLPLVKTKLGAGPQDQEAQKVGDWLDKTLGSIKPEQKGPAVVVNLKIDFGDITPLMSKYLAAATGKVRGAAEATESQNHLKQMALGMMTYADTQAGKMLPAAIYSKDGKQPLYSWRVELLPFVEELALYNQFHRDEPWNSPHNLQLLPRMPKVYRLPGMKPGGDPTKTFYQVFVGPGTPFDPKIKVRFPISFQDGTSNTILIVESASAVPWTAPQDITYNPKIPMSPRLGRHFGNLTNAVLADGSTVRLPPTLSDRTLHLAITIADGMPLGKDWPR